MRKIFKILSREVVLEKPKDKSLAHYASPEAFALAKELRKAPKLIAEELAAKFKPRLRFEILCSQNLGVKFRLLNLAAERASKALNFVGFCARLCRVALVLKF